jgi:hypothetical protein
MANGEKMTIHESATCFHVRGSHVVPGWGCCCCRVYNGYQRSNCRACSHQACYPTDGLLGEEAARFKAAGTDREKVIKLCEALDR